MSVPKPKTEFQEYLEWIYDWFAGLGINSKADIAKWKYKKALQYSLEIFQKTRHTIPATYAAICYLSLEKFEEAQKLFIEGCKLSEVIKHGEPSVFAPLQYAKFLYLLEKYEDALALIEKYKGKYELYSFSFFIPISEIFFETGHMEKIKEYHDLIKEKLPNSLNLSMLIMIIFYHCEHENHPEVISLFSQFAINNGINFISEHDVNYIIELMITNHLTIPTLKPETTEREKIYLEKLSVILEKHFEFIKRSKMWLNSESHHTFPPYNGKVYGDPIKFAAGQGYISVPLKDS